MGRLTQLRRVPPLQELIYGFRAHLRTRALFHLFYPVSRLSHSEFFVCLRDPPDKYH